MMALATTTMTRDPELAPAAVKRAFARLGLPPSGAQRNVLALFRVFAHRGRLLVLLALAERDHCVADLAVLCHASHSAMSHQLKTLRDAGLVRPRRSGKHVLYGLADHEVSRLLQTALRHVAEKKLRRSRRD